MPPESTTSAEHGASVADLLRQHAETLSQLRQRGVIRSNNAPAGDYAEWLVATALGGALTDDKAEKSWDVQLPSGEKVQVKARVVSEPRTRGQLQSSPFRSWDFDVAALVLLSDVDYQVRRAALVPLALVEEASRFRAHVNGSTVLMNDELLAAGTDVTQQMRDAAESA